HPGPPADDGGRRYTSTDRLHCADRAIMASAHTYPIFVRVGGKPIRASRRSAQWCRACVDKLWEVKSPFMRETERAAAAQAFEHARNVYDTIIRECEVDCCVGRRLPLLPSFSWGRVMPATRTMRSSGL